jgi:hypothetical protein
MERLTLFKCTRVDDSIVPVLAKMKLLTWVDLTATKVSADGVAQIKKANPKCRVLWKAVS